MTPAWLPVNDRAWWPRLAMAIASSAIEMRSPAVSSMSSSRPGGSGLTCWARSTSSSVVSPIAETTTTTSWPALRVSTMRLATRLMPSASATDEPPYFCTTRPTADLLGVRRQRARSSLRMPPAGSPLVRSPDPPGAGGQGCLTVTSWTVSASSRSSTRIVSSIGVSRRTCETTECSARSADEAVDPQFDR